MSIRHILLISYLLISITSALIITAMVYSHLQDLLKIEIENKLQSQASTIMHQIDMTLFERMEDISIWSRLEVMQDIRVQDLDKRIALFLKEIRQGYDGVYRDFLVTDRKGQVLASSTVEKKPPLSQPVVATRSLLLEKQVWLQQVDLKNDRLFFFIRIADHFQSRELGRLYAAFNWQEIYRLLEIPLPFSIPSAPSYALLLDANERIIAASSYIRQLDNWRFLSLKETLKLKDDSTGKLIAKIDWLNDQPMMIGYAHSQGYRAFGRFGWSVLIMQPAKQALSSVSQLWQVFALFLLATFLLAILVSFWMSARIARPIVRLADFTRDFMQGKSAAPPVLKSSREIDELSRRFALMINNLEQSHQDLVRAAKLAVIGEMAASMAHEVRTPLGILRSSVQILQRQAQLDEVGQEMLEFIVSETDRLNVLITSLLDCAKPKPPQFSQHDINAIIEHVCSLLKSKIEEKKIILVKNLAGSGTYLICDRELLIQVFLNLLMNATQHTPEGGEVTVTTTHQNNTIVVNICDNGRGISDQDKDNIFDPFFTRRETGIGLGLTVVQQIISTHQGKISVRDNPVGKGTCFQINFQNHHLNISE